MLFETMTAFVLSSVLARLTRTDEQQVSLSRNEIIRNTILTTTWQALHFQAKRPKLPTFDLFTPQRGSNLIKQPTWSAMELEHRLVIGVN